MSFIHQCFQEHESAFTDCLLRLDFSNEQADSFFSIIRDAITNAIDESSVFQTIHRLINDPAAFLHHMTDVDATCKNCEIHYELAVEGMDTIGQTMLVICAKHYNC